MANLTIQQMADLRADLGDSNVAFDDPELQRLWDRTSSATSDYTRYRATLGLAWQQIMAGAAKYHDYEAGAVKEKLSQIFQHAKQMVAVYESDIEAAFSQKQDFVKSKIGITPHQTRTEPYDGYTQRRRPRP